MVGGCYSTRYAPCSAHTVSSFRYENYFQKRHWSRPYLYSMLNALFWSSTGGSIHETAFQGLKFWLLLSCLDMYWTYFVLRWQWVGGSFCCLGLIGLEIGLGCPVAVVTRFLCCFWRLIAGGWFGWWRLIGVDRGFVAWLRRLIGTGGFIAWLRLAITGRRARLIVTGLVLLLFKQAWIHVI